MNVLCVCVCIYVLIKEIIKIVIKIDTNVTLEDFLLFEYQSEISRISR